MPDERLLGLPVAHFGLKRAEIAGLDVRRVGHDEVVWPARQPLRDVVARERHAIGEPVRSAFSRASARASSETSIAEHGRLRPLVRDGERYRTRARADVEHRGRVHTVEQREAALDDDLRLRPRDKRARVHFQHQPPKPPFAEDVRERLARAAPPHELAAGGRLLVRERAVVLEIEVESGDAERMGDEMLRVDARAGDILAREEVGRSLDDLADRHPSRRTRGAPPAHTQCPCVLRAEPNVDERPAARCLEHAQRRGHADTERLRVCLLPRPELEEASRAVVVVERAKLGRLRLGEQPVCDRPVGACRRNALHVDAHVATARDREEDDVAGA